MNEIKYNKTDLIVSASKSVLGAIPFAGSLLSELVGELIPNQRLERLTKYVIELDEKLSKISSEMLDSLKDKIDFIDLIEEGFVQASRAITDVRRQYISSIIANGISDEDVSLNDSKYLLKILQELNDVEIIWLRYYIHPYMGGDDEFREVHKNVLTPISVYMGSDRKTMVKASIQESYKEHLNRLELIESKIKLDDSLGVSVPVYDKFSKKPKTSSTSVTNLGRLLLKQIGLIEEKEEID
jgi:hypothetical protein